MSSIHPTAIVHPEAKLGPGVQVGPYAIIEGPAEIGEGCVIQAHAILTGFVRMGARNTVGYGALVGGDPQDTAFAPATESHVVIGDDNRLREYCTLHRGSVPGSQTRVGNRCFLMGGVHLAHNVVVGDGTIIANNSLLGGHVHVGEGVFIGGGCVFHQFVRVGRNAIVQGQSALSKDVPPYLLACRRNRVGGLNVVGLRRAGFDPAVRREIKEAFKLLYKSGLNTSQALERARERTWSPEVEAFFAFVAQAGRRGICDLAESKRGAPEAEG